MFLKTKTGIVTENSMTNGIIYCTSHDENPTIRNWFCLMTETKRVSNPAYNFLQLNAKHYPNRYLGKTSSISVLHLRWNRCKSTSASIGDRKYNV